MYESISDEDKKDSAKQSTALKAKMGLGQNDMAWQVQLRQMKRSVADSCRQVCIQTMQSN